MAKLHQFSNVLFNIFIFIVIQAIFFYYVSATFANNIIEDKVNRISDIFYKQLQLPQKQLLLQQLEQEKVNIEEQAALDKQKRDATNAVFLLVRMGIIAGLALLGFFGSVYAIWGFDFSCYDRWAYFFMMMAYTTEVGVYFILMNRFEYIGTFEILKKINEKLPEINLSMFRQQY